MTHPLIDHVKSFIETKCVKESDFHKTSAHDLHSEFVKWASEEFTISPGRVQERMPKTMFGKCLATLGLKRTRDSKMAYWIGISLVATNAHTD